MKNDQLFDDFRELMYDLESYLSTQAGKERLCYISQAAELTRRVSRMIPRIEKGLLDKPRKS